MNKNFYIETFGCQMNKSDSELIALSLENCGFTEAETVYNTDLAVFNTCSVRQHAEDRVISRIESVRNRLKKNALIVLTGCMAQRVGENLIDQKLVDIVIGPYQSPKIGEIIKKYYNNKNEKIFRSQESKNFENRINYELAEKKNLLPWHKWVTITHGCENFCSYCIVPYVRGKLISLSYKSIIEYVNRSALNNINEITLLGQNVNQYRDRDIPFYKLLERVSKINGLTRINFLTSHPKDFDDNIIYVIRDNENISRSIHLPLQSGSNEILKLMNRKYTIEHYYKIVEKIKNTLDRHSISTDIIVGFPGETEVDYNSTLEAVKQIKFDQAFMYTYSPREGASASKLREFLTREEKINRLNTLIEIQGKISKEKLQTMLNCNEKMIVERISKKSKKEVMGKTFLNHPVVIPGIPEDIGKKFNVRITGLKGSTLCGEKILAASI